jgi:hypothetical protein
MTLDEAIAKSTRLVTQSWAENEAEELERLRAAGATDDDLAAVSNRSRETLPETLRKTNQMVAAVWYTGEAGIH